MPSPAAGKSDTPRTPTKLGRKPQQSAPKLNKPQSQAPDTSDLSEKAQSTAEDTKNQAQDTAEDTAEQAKDTAEDTKDTAADTAKDTQKKAEDTAADTKKQVEDTADDAEDTAEDTTGKVSQKGDELSEAEPKPIDDDEDEEAEETEDDATQKAGDDAEDTVDNTEDDATDTASKAGEGALSGARGLAGRASNLAGKASKDPKGAVEDAADQSQDKSALDAADDATEAAKDTAQEGQDAAEDATDDVQDKAGDATDDVEDKAEDAKATADDKTGDVEDTADDAKDGVQDTTDDVKDSVEDQTGGLDLSLLRGLEVDEEGLISKDGKPVGRLVEGDAEDLAGYPIGDNGEILDDDGDLVGRCELLPEDQLPDELKKGAEDAGPKMPPLSILKGLTADRTGQILNEDGDFVGHLVEGDPSDIQGKQFNEDGEILDDDGNVIARAELHPDAADLVDDDDEEEDEEGGAAEGAVDGIKDTAEDAKDDVKDTAEDAAEDAKDEIEDKAADVEDELPGVEALEGLEVNSEGEVLNDDGEVVGQVGEDFDGDVKDLKGLTVNEKGEVVDSEGNVLGSVELAEGAAEKLKDSAKGALDIRILDGLKVNKKGKVLDAEGEEIGELIEGEAKDCAGKTINEQGEVLDKEGKPIGKVQVVAGEAAFEAQKELKERLGEVEPEVKEVEVTPDLDTLDGLKVNKKGQVLDEDGEPIGELEEGDIKECAGKKINEKGEVLDKDGNVIGKVKTLPKIIEQQVEQAEDAEEGAEDAEEGAEDAQAAAEEAQDAAEDAAEDAEEAGEDNLPPLSILDGLTVNKSGKLINDNGDIVGELTEGDAKKLSKAGITCDAEGQFWDNKGKVIGRAQTVPQEEGEDEAPFAGLEGLTVVKDGYVEDENGNRVGQVVEGDAKKLIGRAVDEDGDILDKKGSVVGHAERYEEEDVPEEDAPEPEDLSILKGKTVNKQGNVIGDEGVPIGRLVEGNPKELNGRQIDDNGQIWNDAGKVIGRCELIPENERETKPEGIFGGLEGLRVVADGKVADEDENIVGEVVEGNAKRLVGLRVDEDGDILDKFGNVKGHAEPLEEEDPEEEVPEDLSSLEGLTLNKSGKLVNQEGIPIGRLVEGNLKELAGRKSDGEGLIHNDTGKVVGRCELIPENERESKPEGIFGGLEGLRVIADGKVADADENVVGVVTEGDAKRLIGLRVDEDGDILDKHGNVKGHAEPVEDEEEEAPADLSSLDGLTLNKQGYLVNGEGIPVGKLVEGNLKELAGRKSDGEGLIHGDTGKIVGRCELIPDNERVTRQEGPFAGFEGLRVVKDGFVEDNDGNRVGQITEGDAKKLVGHSVDEDGDIIDKYGNVKGHAEPFEEEEAAEVDLSALAGCTVNKAGNVVDSSGQILGRVSEGDPSTMIGKKVDGKGQIWDNAGNIVGRAELAPGAQSGAEGPFAGFDDNTVAKDGTVQTPSGDIIGRVIEGDIKKLVGHHVDEDGDINDKNGNVIGKAERWEPEEKERRINPMSGMRVNKEGEVRDENGDVIGRLTAGDLGHCAGLEIDDNGYVIDNDGNKVGEVTLLGNIQEEEIPEDETDEERQRREDSELANKMAGICQQTLERVQPVMKQITEHIEKADRTPRDELDEEELVNNVKPLIEEGGRILNECNGSLRGLDPDGRIAAQAKGRQQTGEATPEEYKLADCLKELTSSVVTTIDNAKKKISDMPHAKKKLNPLWGLLTEPLFQIIAAVGLLLTGVLNLVGKLLNGLGLGGLVNGLLGGLGINKLLSGLGLGGLFGGDDKKKKKSGGGASNIPLVGGLLGGK